MQVTYKDEVIDFTIDYSKRKHIQIRIEYPGLVIVSSPKDVEESRIKEIVLAKAEPILGKIKEMSSVSRVLKENEYVNGELYLFLGNPLSLRIIIDESILKTQVEIKGEELLVTIKQNDRLEIKKALEKFYKRQCSQKIKKRIAFYQKQFKIKPKAIEIMKSNDLWGSCSSERNLRFNWRLMMAPEESIDYIVVHEMCHLVHMNHSKSFWTLVGKIMPDYKMRSKWLETNGHHMTL